MKYDCDMISDLLPLYKDEICSDSSRRIVEEHLAECPSCAKTLKDLGDSRIDEEIIKEKNEVIDSQARFFKRKSAIAGAIVAGIFALPILVCLIADIATGGGLTWFFIVMAAMMIPTSLIVVPLLMPRNKMLATMGAFTASVILLLAVCAIYSRGSWFFIAATAVLFGLTIFFAPFIACRRPVKDHLKNFKGVAILGAYTATFVLMMVTIGLHVRTAEYFAIAASICIPILLVCWGVFATIRYLPVNALTKTGISVALISILTYLPSLLANSVAGSVSRTGVVSATIPTPALMIIGLAIGAVLAGIGITISLVKGGKTK